MIKKHLQDDIAIEFRSTGNSLNPLVYSGDLCVIHQIDDISKLQVGDIVLREVQEGSRFFVREILGNFDYEGSRCYWISNNEDPVHINGWRYDHHIHGILIEVLE